MNSIVRFFKKFSIFVRRGKFERELNEEMAFHRQQIEAQLSSEGAAPGDAGYSARRSFGNPGHLQDRSRDVVSFWFETAVRDFRFALRQLAKNPGFAVTAILVLALGICSSVAIFAFTDAALIKQLPYKDPSRLVAVYESAAVIPRSNLSYLDFLDWKQRNTVFESFDIWTGSGYLLRTRDGIQPTRGARVSAGFFRTLGVSPVLGRDFAPGEDKPGAASSVILSYAAWQKWFAGREDVLGQPITLSDVPYTVIGVLPRAFQFAPRGALDFWVTDDGANPCEKRRSCHNLYGVARLKSGVSAGTALAEMQAIARRLEDEYPGSNRGQGAAVVPLREAVSGNVRPILLLLLAGAALLLLISCVNVTSLVLARAESRRREIAVRGALGASFVRLARQFATEGFVLVLIAATSGLFAANLSIQLLRTLIPDQLQQSMPYLEDLGLNAHVLAFAGAVSLLATLLFALSPSLRLRRADMRDGLAEGGRGSANRVWRRFGTNLAVIELAIAVVLLAGAGLLGKSFYRLLRVSVGFQPDHLATLQVAAPDAIYKTHEQAAALGREVIRRLSALPGVQSVAITTTLPVSFNGNTDWIRIVGKPYDGKHIEVNERDVSAGYFQTLQAKLIHGRFFTPEDELSKTKIVIINKVLADRYFPNEDPVGQKIGNPGLTPDSIREIVGVVDSIREGPLDTEVWPAEYAPFQQEPSTYFSLVVRTGQQPEAVLPSLTDAIHKIDPNLGTLNEVVMADRISDSPAAYLHRSAAWLVGGFAAMALLLGVVGLYGVISYSVSQRTREIGVRMAVGASRGSVLQLILRDAGRLAALGAATGLVCAVGAAMLMRSLLFGVESWDVPTLLGVALLLVACAMSAALVPARRAASLDPVVALRTE